MDKNIKDIKSLKKKMTPNSIIQTRGQQTPSVKDQMVNTSCFAGHVMSVTSIQF